jgi:hypothetical protein
LHSKIKKAIIAYRQQDEAGWIKTRGHSAGIDNRGAHHFMERSSAYG